MSLGDPRVTVIIVALSALGACIGSFLNVVAYRLPRECMTIARPRSGCTRCGRLIAWYDNVPVLSWVFLRGKCRGCGASISVRYPCVELGTALVFGWLGARVLPDAAFEQPMAFGSAWLVLVVMLTITSVLIALALIDLDYRILPDELTKSGIVLGPALAFCAPDMQHGAYLISLDSSRWSAAASGAVGVVLAGGLLWSVGWLGSKAFKKDAMGFGDVKMIAAMGGCIGHWALLSLAVAALCGAVIGIVVRLVTAGRYIPFGPFLAIGMWTVMLWGPEIWNGYIGLFRP